MKEKHKEVIHRLNNFLNRPIVIVFTLLFLFAYFAIGNAHFEKENRVLLQNTQRSADNTNTIIHNLKEAVTDLQKDNERQTRFISCLLALQGRPDLVPTDVQAQCSKMSLNVDIGDVTRSTNTSSTTPSVAKPQPAPVPQPTAPAPQPTKSNNGPVANALSKLPVIGRFFK